LKETMISFGLMPVIKVLVSVLFVVGLALIAERVGPRAAGILSGYPLGAAIALFFIGIEISPGFAARSAVYTAAGLVATLAFVTGYLQGLKRAAGRGRIAAIGISVLAGITLYGLTSRILSLLPLNLIGAVLIATAAIALAGYRFRTIADVRMVNSVRMGVGVTLARAAFAAFIILCVTTAAQVVGPSWAGLFSAFPSTMLPLLVIIHFTYQADHVRTIIKNVPRGLQSLLVYVIVVALAYPGIGVVWGTLAAYGAATAYLLAIR
jgi:hypothetical protein